MTNNETYYSNMNDSTQETSVNNIYDTAHNVLHHHQQYHNSASGGMTHTQSHRNDRGLSNHHHHISESHPKHQAQPIHQYHPYPSNNSRELSQRSIISKNNQDQSSSPYYQQQVHHPATLSSHETMSVSGYQQQLHDHQMQIQIRQQKLQQEQDDLRYEQEQLHREQQQQQLIYEPRSNRYYKSQHLQQPTTTIIPSPALHAPIVATTTTAMTDEAIQNTMSIDQGSDTIFGLPPIPKSIQEFALLPLPGNDGNNKNNEPIVPPIHVLEGDLIIYQYIANRARVIADSLDASIITIQNAIAATKNKQDEAINVQNTCSDDTKKLMVHTPATAKPLVLPKKTRPPKVQTRHVNNNNNNTTKHPSYLDSNIPTHVFRNVNNNSNIEDVSLLEDNNTHDVTTMNEISEADSYILAERFRQHFTNQRMKLDAIKKANSEAKVSLSGNANHDNDMSMVKQTKNKNPTTNDEISDAESFIFAEQMRQHFNNKRIQLATIKARREEQILAPTKRDSNNNIVTQIDTNNATGDATNIMNDAKTGSLNLKSQLNQCYDKNDIELVALQNANQKIRTLINTTNDGNTKVSQVEDTDNSYKTSNTTNSISIKPAERLKQTYDKQAMDSVELQKMNCLAKNDTNKALQSTSANSDTQPNHNDMDVSMGSISVNNLTDTLVDFCKGQQFNSVDSQHDTTDAINIQRILNFREYLKKNSYDIDDLNDANIRNMERILLEAHTIVDKTKMYRPNESNATSFSPDKAFDEIDRDYIESIIDQAHSIVLGNRSTSPHCHNDISVTPDAAFVSGRKIEQATCFDGDEAIVNNEESQTLLANADSTKNMLEKETMLYTESSDNNTSDNSAQHHSHLELESSKKPTSVENSPQLSNTALLSIPKNHEVYDKIRNIEKIKEEARQIAFAHVPKALKRKNDTEESVLSNHNESEESVTADSFYLKTIETMEKLKEEARLAKIQLQYSSQYNTNDSSRRLMAMHSSERDKKIENVQGQTSTSHSETLLSENDLIFKPGFPRNIDSSGLIDSLTWSQVLTDCELLHKDDIGIIPDCSFVSIAQFQPCSFTKDDGLGRYVQHEIGYIGFSCKHCFGAADYGRYFLVSPATFAATFPGIAVNHIVHECPCCPRWLKVLVTELDCTGQISPLRNISYADGKDFLQNLYKIARAESMDTVNTYDEMKKARALTSKITSTGDKMTWGDILCSSSIVFVEDLYLVPNSHVAIFAQYELCEANEIDCNRVDKFRSPKAGFPGISCKYCRHMCYTPGSRIFANTADSFSDFSNEMKKHVTKTCPDCPASIRLTIDSLITQELTESRYYGYSTMFFRRVLKRIHGIDLDEKNKFITQNNLGMSAKGGESSAIATFEELLDGSPLVSIRERGMVSDAHLAAYAQLKPCRLKESDKSGWYKDRVIGYPGVCCRYCGGRVNSGRFFPKIGTNFLRSSKNAIIRHLTVYCTESPNPIRKALQQIQSKELQQSNSNQPPVVLGAGKTFHEMLWIRVYQYYNIPIGYYDLLDSSNSSNTQNVDYNLISQPVPDAQLSQLTPAPEKKKQRIDSIVSDTGT